MLGGDDGRTLYIVANHYSDSGASDGIVLIQSVAAPHAGRPWETLAAAPLTAKPLTAGGGAPDRRSWARRPSPRREGEGILMRPLCQSAARIGRKPVSRDRCVP